MLLPSLVLFTNECNKTLSRSGKPVSKLIPFHFSCYFFPLYGMKHLKQKRIKEFKTKKCFRTTPLFGQANALTASK